MATATITTLPLSVLRAADGIDCSLNGISAQHTRLDLVGTCTDSGKVTALPEGLPTSTEHIAAPVLLNSRNLMHGTVLNIIPAIWNEESQTYGADKRWHMQGGNCAQFTDSRTSRLVESKLGNHFYGALAIHDRHETR